MFARLPLPQRGSIGRTTRLDDRHGERHRISPFQAIRDTLSRPGVEHLRPAVREAAAVVLRPSESRVWVVEGRGGWVVPADEPPPHAEGYQTESEDADADEPDEDGRR